MFFKLKIHSVVDVITNSSTTIYSYYDGCVKPAKEMINEFAKAMGSKLKADDMFFIGVFAEDNYTYTEGGDRGIWEDGSDDDPFKDVTDDFYKFCENTIENILTGKIEKPQWMIDCEEYEDYEGLTPSTVLYIKPKSPEFENIGLAMLSFLNSTHEEASYNG